MIHVIHKRDEEKYPYPHRVYIGRGSALGNPFTHKPVEKTKALFQCSTAHLAVACYRTYLHMKVAEKDPDICLALNSIYLKARQHDVYLVCFCVPGPCHGTTIKELIEEKMR